MSVYKFSFSLVLLLLSLSAGQTTAHQHGPRNRHAHAQAQRNLEERLLPITATTTVIVEMTRTETVWVAPTGQVILAPQPGASSSESSVGTESAISSAATSSHPISSGHPSSSGGISSSAVPTTSPSMSPSASSIVSSSAESSPPISSSAYPSSSHISSAAVSSSIPSSSSSSSIASSSGSPYISLDLELSSASSSGFASSSVATSTPHSSSAVPSSSVVASSSAMSSSAMASSSAVASESSMLLFPSSSVVSSSSSTIVSSSMASSTAASSTILSSSSSHVSSTKSSTSSSASATSTSTLETLGSTLMNAYYPDWSGWYLTPEQVDWSKYDVIDFAFALPTADYNLEFTQSNSADLLTRLVKTGHAAGKRVKLSIGGWTGSTYFSTICASASNRKTFVANILAAYKLYNLDGIDIDWEYPGVQGAASNAVSSSDSANFLLFLIDLRAALPTGALISTATQVWPFAGPNGSPMSDVSGFAAVIDWILIMNYDVWGSSSTPGANAPLSDGCKNSSQPLANAYAAVSSWTTAGMPASKITLGVPAYGYLQKSTATGLKDRRGMLSPPGRLRSNNHGRSSLTVYNDNGGTADGQVMFEDLISQGALALDSSGLYIGANGFTREWDSCSSTPWLKSTYSGQIVTYDDPTSMSLKGQFAAQAGIRGCNVFSIDGDWTGSGFPLTDAVRSGMGL